MKNFFISLAAIALMTLFGSGLAMAATPVYEITAAIHSVTSDSTVILAFGFIGLTTLAAGYLPVFSIADGDGGDGGRVNETDTETDNEQQSEPEHVDDGESNSGGDGGGASDADSESDSTD